MADSFKKKEREKKKRKRKKEKAERKQQRQQEDGKTTDEFMYVDENGNLTATPPDPDKKPKIKAEDIVLGIPPKSDSDDDGSPFERTGKVKFFNTEKGYGFITDNKNNQSVFVHAENLEDTIQDNDQVRFEIGNGPKGPIALKVKLDQ